MGNHEKALQEIDIYLEKFPDDGYAHEKRANILFTLEDLTRPSRNATRPSSLNPSCRCLLRKGYILYYTGRFKESLSYFDKVIELNSKSAYAYYSKEMPLNIWETLKALWKITTMP